MNKSFSYQETTQETSTSQTTSKSKQQPEWLMKAAPWMAGTGIAIGHVLTSSNCTIPQQGRCTSCGSCVVALGSLVAWAGIKNRKGGEFYLED